MTETVTRSTSATPTLDVRNVRVGFRRRRREPMFYALDDVSLTVRPGRTTGLVGESGSGKSTLAKAVLGLVPVEAGSIELLGRDITHLPTKQRRGLGSSLQAVFQDPRGSLNPSYPVGRSLAEPLRAQGVRSRQEIAGRTKTMLEDVGVEPAAAARYPRQFSGGQLQRISIARALMTSPQVVLCDEAVSALDLSVQAQILNLLADLQAEHDLSYLFISHDMSVVRHLCHDLTVLYRGQVMEAGTTKLVTHSPAHPYTRALLLAAPVADPTVQKLRRTAAAGPAPTDATSPSSAAPGRISAGCPFAPRCPFAVEQCWSVRPELRTVADGRQVACHRYPEWQRDAPTELLIPSATSTTTGQAST